MKPLRVALVTPAFLRWDGVGRSTRAKIDALISAGHVPTLYVPTDGPVSAIPGVPCHRLEATRVIKDVVTGQGHTFLEHDLHVFEVVAASPLLWLSQILEGRRLLFDYHGVTPPHLVSDPHNKESLSRTRDQLKLLAPSGLTIVHSRHSREELGSAGGPPAQRCRVVPIPTLVPAEPGSEALTWARGLGGATGPMLLYVGRMAGNKGLPMLVETLARVHAHRPGTRLVLVGDDSTGEYRQHARRARLQAADLGLAHRVVFTGPIDDERLAALYRVADLLLIASDHEGFCVPVAEAFSVGLPAVVTDAGALPETAAGGAIIVPRGDVSAMARAVVDLLEESARRAALSRGARSAANRFETAAVARAFLDVVDESMGLEPRPRMDRVGLIASLASLPLTYHDPFYARPGWTWVARWRRKVTLHLEKYLVRRMEARLRSVATGLIEGFTRVRARIETLDGDRRPSTDSDLSSRS